MIADLCMHRVRTFFAASIAKVLEMNFSLLQNRPTAERIRSISHGLEQFHAHYGENDRLHETAKVCILSFIFFFFIASVVPNLTYMHSS